MSWRSSKQDTMANSTTEAEYMATSDAAKEAVWIKNFVFRLGVVPSITNPVDVYCDNNGAIAQAKEPISHQRSKHILRRFHLIREIIERGDVKICRVHTDDNVADPLTKPLPHSKHDCHTRSIDIRFMPDWIRASGRLLVICSSLVAYTLSLYVYIHEAFIILSCYLNCGLT